MRYRGHEKELKGGEALTTNNRMELTAAVEALRSLNRSCEVTVHTDSQYLRGGVTGWIDGWKRNGWRTAAKKPVKNEDLWRALDAATHPHKIEWRWVKGHADDALNVRADKLAREGMAAFLARPRRSSGFDRVTSNRNHDRQDEKPRSNLARRQGLHQCSHEATPRRLRAFGEASGL